MTKLLHKSASIAVTLISLSLIVLVVISVLPLVKGDMGLEEVAPFDMNIDEDSGMAIITGSYKITSGLPFDITDINAGVSIDDGNGGGLEIFKKGPLTVTGNGEYVLDVHSEVFIPSVLIAALAANFGSEDDGLYLPLTIEVSGSYLDRLISLKVSANMNIVISDVEIPPFSVEVLDAAGDVTDSPNEAAKITVQVEEIPGGDLMDDMPDNAVIRVPIGDDGKEVVITFSKTGPDGDGNYEISLTVESSDGTLMDALDYLIGEGEAVEIDLDGYATVLDPESVALLAESLKAALEALTS